MKRRGGGVIPVEEDVSDICLPATVVILLRKRRLHDAHLLQSYVHLPVLPVPMVTKTSCQRELGWGVVDPPFTKP